MPTYTAQVSSLYPIDLAAALYAGVFDTTSSHRIFLSDAAELPQNLLVREYVARSALPLCAWTLDTGTVWRQLHAPLETVETARLVDSLLMVGKSLCHQSDLDEAVMLRCRQLAESSFDRAARSNVRWRSLWAPFVSGIIEEIFEQVLQVRPQVEPYWPFRLGLQHEGSDDWAASRDVLHKLLKAASQVSPRSLRFVRGGYLEMEDPSNRGVWLRFSQISFNGSFVECRGDADARLRLTASETENIRFRFGGPLEMAQLQEFGLMVDLPWYSDSTISWDQTEPHSGVEFISPITAKANKRVSRVAGGEGYRLLPSGYSLVEFDSPIIRRFISNKLRTRLCSEEDLTDWRRLTREFPQTPQRLSKDQHAARAYRNLRETQSRQRIAEGNLSNLNILRNRIDDIHPLLYGPFLVEVLGVIALFKEWASPNCPNAAPRSVVDFLSHIKWIDQLGVVAPGELVPVIDSCVRATQRWLTGLGFSVRAGDAQRLEEACETLLRSGNRSILKSTSQVPTPGGFGLAAKMLRDVLDAYYAFAGFCVGALFKAQVLFPFLLLGPDEYRLQIEKHLLLRGEKKCLVFEPILWRATE